MTDRVPKTTERRKSVAIPGGKCYDAAVGGGEHVRVEIQINPALSEPRLVLQAPELTDELAALARRLSEPERAVPAQTPRGVALLKPEEILRVYAQRQRVFAQTAQGVFPVKFRLYELEERLGEEFVRISSSELVRASAIRSMDFSLAGTIRLTLEDGTVTYVSRRQVAKIKKRFER